MSKLLLAPVLAALAVTGPTSSSAGGDRDHDRLPDKWERRHGFSTKQKSARGDADRDGLRNLREYRLRTNPRKADTDGDGIRDGREVRSGTSPRVAIACDTTVTGADGVRAAVRSHAGKRICYRGTIEGDLDLSGLRPDSETTVAPAREGGTVTGQVVLANAANLAFEGRARSATIHSGASQVTLRNCSLGGSAGARVTSNLVLIQSEARGIAVRDCSLGWSSAAPDTGNVGYGIRILDNGTVEDITIERNRIHHIAADGIQVGGNPPGVTIDRNEIAYVAVDEDGLSEHSDLIQLVEYGDGTRITNNYMHHLGYRDESHRPSHGYPSGGLYVHGGNGGRLQFENNLVVDGRNMPTFGDLGTGGCEFDNLSVRRNTFARMGTSVGGTDLIWAVCGGQNDVLERNAVQNLRDKHHGGELRDNVTGSRVVLDERGNCVSGACNPDGAEPIGYRKPAGVDW